ASSGTRSARASRRRPPRAVCPRPGRLAAPQRHANRRGDVPRAGNPRSARDPPGRGSSRANGQASSPQPTRNRSAGLHRPSPGAPALTAPSPSLHNARQEGSWLVFRLRFRLVLPGQGHAKPQAENHLSTKARTRANLRGIMIRPNKLRVFSGRANPALAEKIVAHLGDTLGRVSIADFPDGETMVKIEEDVRGGDVFIVQPTCPPVNQHLMELLIMLDCFKRASAAPMTVVLPYYGY